MLLDNYKSLGEVIDLPLDEFEAELDGMTLGELSNLDFLFTQEFRRAALIQNDFTERMEGLSKDSDTFKEMRETSLALYGKMELIENKSAIVKRLIDMLTSK